MKRDYWFIFAVCVVIWLSWSVAKGEPADYRGRAHQTRLIQLLSQTNADLAEIRRILERDEMRKRRCGCPK